MNVGRFYVSAIFVGIIGGGVGVGFHLMVDAAFDIHRMLKEALDGTFLEVAVFALISAIMMLAATFIVRSFAPEAAGSGVQEIEGTLEDKRTLRWARILPVKFAAGVLALSSGLVLGREGPTIHMGASAGLGIATFAGLPRIEQKALIAAGAAAGLASAFNAPVAAVLFVIEETRKQFPWTFPTYNAVIIASALSALITESVAGVGPDLTISGLAMPPLEHMIFFVFLGFLMGVIGVLFNTLLIRIMDAVAKCGTSRPYLFPLAIGGIIGALLVVFPDVTGGGDSLIPHLISADFGTELLLLLLMIRCVTTFGSYAAGVPGGIFAPMLALATTFGLVFVALLAAVVPEVHAEAPAFAIAAMGGFFAATVRAPLVGVVLVAELTGAYDLMLPVLITCGLANITAHQLNGQPIYEQLLARTLRLAHLPADQDVDRVPVRLGVRD